MSKNILFKTILNYISTTKQTTYYQILMNEGVSQNYAKLKLSAVFLPIFLLISVVAFLYIKNALNVNAYSTVQKELFISLNSKLSQFPSIQYNLTQFGDALVFFSFLSIFIIYAPKIWEALIASSLISLLLCCLLKNIFHVPRPAATLDNDSFVIIGETLASNNSLPSGHSITIFTSLTVLMYAFMPKKFKYKFFWCLSIITLGLILVATRVGVGAHYPIDVIVGSIIGYILGLIGIFVSRKYSLLTWVSNKKYCPIFIALFSACCFLLVNRLIHNNLIIYYFSLASLLTTLYIITNAQVKNQFKLKPLRTNNKLS
ncbi:phosphatase PAP2 family protein [Pedobacter xixiisoli]|uniref:Membrane-associated phospholipid phosphatase n=1 Tax=Pedobacter xixiisoli TaxID=1476464 RepID=A0A286AE41_9SPHI|nr:phosphatase PAP2 family protein [Pedobacter xixiisoli]SOD20170.1 Membrane-associated phospholipid phosphatase [Pedobacter xixiisoli]